MEEMETQDEVRVAWGTGIAGHVAESGEPVNIPDAYEVSLRINFFYTCLVLRKKLINSLLLISENKIITIYVSRRVWLHKKLV
jgi:hypothetical protein